MMRKHTLTAALIVSAFAVTACGQESDSPAPVETSTTSPTAVVTEAEDDDTERLGIDPENLPTVENTRIDHHDPSDVAQSFVRLSTTFAPDIVVDERDQVERGYPLTTRRYRETYKPLETNPDIVRTRSWYNQSTTDDDPVEIVESTVGWALRPVPVTGGETRVVREIQSVQVPVTASGRELKERTLDWRVTLVKQDDDKWLVDDATSDYAED